jgi:energy-coupling factor transport system permease protein
VRELDPRVKVLQLLLVSLCIFLTRSIAAQALTAGAVAAIVFATGERRRAIHFAVFVAVLMAVLLSPIGSARGMAAFYVKFVLFFIVKFSPGVLFVILLTETEDVTRFIHALEQLWLPRVLTLPLAVALRFVPSLGYELACIKDAMRLRGLQPTLVGFYRHPILTLEYLSVPLLMRSLKIADELSASALTRGIDAAGPHTRYAPLVFRLADAGGAAASVAAAAAIVALDRLIV